MGAGDDLAHGEYYWPRLRLLLVTLVLCRGLVVVCALPPFEAWDEYQHVAYVQHIAETGRSAILHETKVPASLLLAQESGRSAPYELAWAALEDD